ncbi:hypothetical protein L210DRAFT_3510013 [Boletus edulis BED1]|uniref:Uncharacterized protein n=1 Tax=Boletus edulis BED1 TaxID=1328754 RepID=A0AAD4BDY2_BOLED|nr:hypothetical protein L210DRAFT_3510013 [Boletus edulis BED1]
MDLKVIRKRKRKNGRTIRTQIAWIRTEGFGRYEDKIAKKEMYFKSSTIDFIVQGIPQTASETLMENSDKRSLFTDGSAGSVEKYYATVSAMVIRRNPPSLHWDEWKKIDERREGIRGVNTESDTDQDGRTSDDTWTDMEGYGRLDGRLMTIICGLESGRNGDYNRREHRAPTSVGDLNTDCPQVRNRNVVSTNTSSLGYISFSSSLIMLAILDILALAQPLADDDPKTLAQKELNAAYEHMDALVRTHLDDKEMLAEDQETWVGVWEQSLIKLRACLLAARALGIHAAVRPHIVEGMAESQPFAEKWTTEIADRRQEAERREREERERIEQEPANSVAKGVTAEEVRGDEDGSGKVDEDANAKDDAGNDAFAPPTRESTTSGEGSRTSRGMRTYVQVPARAKRSRIVLDDDDEDEEDVDLQPVKKTSGSPPTVTHKVPCKKAAEDEAATDKKGKGKVAARPTRVRQEVEDPIELVDTEEEEPPKKVPQMKTQPKAQVTDPVHDAGVRAVKRLEAKILKNQARMKAAEADMVDMGAEVDSQRVELDAIKKALGMK